MRDYIDDFEICFSDLSDEAKLALCKQFGGKENLKKFLYWRENLNGNGILTTIESFYDDWADEDFDQYPDFDTFMEVELAGLPEVTDESVNRSKMMKDVEKNMFNDINRTENGSLNEARNNLYDDTYKPDFKKPITINTVNCNEVMCDFKDSQIIKAVDNLATMAWRRSGELAGWEYFADIADACGVSFYVVPDPAFAEGGDEEIDTDSFLASTFE